MTDRDAVTLQSVEMFRTVWALCELSPATKRLRATHYAVWAGGHWLIFNLDGRLIMLFDSRAAIDAHYRRRRAGDGKVWRRRAGAFQVTRVLSTDLDPTERHAHLRAQLGSAEVVKLKEVSNG